MVIVLIGDSCIEKSAIAELLKNRLDAEVICVKNYLEFTLMPQEYILVLITSNPEGIRLHFFKRMQGSLPASAGAALIRKYERLSGRVQGVQIDMETVSEGEASELILSMVVS